MRQKGTQHYRRHAGFTLAEVLIVTAIVSILAMVALPAYQEAIKKAAIVDAKSDILRISSEIERYYADRSSFPPDLETTSADRIDPWGNDFQYTNMALLNGNEKKRKNKDQTPLNTDYDLYSMGPDGRSVAPLTAKPSRDDIIRAGNGRFFGTAADFQ